MAKDKGGHGSEGRGGGAFGRSAFQGKLTSKGIVKVSVNPAKLGYRMADIGAGGKEHNVQTGGAPMAAHQTGVEAARDTPRTELDPATAASRGAFQQLGTPDGSKSLAERFPTTNPDSNFKPQSGGSDMDKARANLIAARGNPLQPFAAGMRTPQVAAMSGMTPLGIKPQGK